MGCGGTFGDPLGAAFALDASRSMGREGVEARVELVRATLAHVPEARVEVIAYRRTPERLFGVIAMTDEGFGTSWSPEGLEAGPRRPGRSAGVSSRGSGR